MGLQDFEVHVRDKTETRGLEMVFLVKIPETIASVISKFFQGEPNEI